MYRFNSQIEAKAYVANKIDNPVANEIKRIGQVILHSLCLPIDNDSFTNIYTVSIKKDRANPSINIHDNLKTLSDIAIISDRQISASGGFFFLADDYIQKPKSLALNLAIQDGSLHSLPARNQEAIIVTDGGISCITVKSLGELSMGNRQRSWSGSLTNYSTDWKIYTNGNTKIVHENNLSTGSRRSLVESSRFTPNINNSLIDIGLTLDTGNKYDIKLVNHNGKTNIFDYDVVIRGRRDLLISDNNKVHFQSIDNRDFKDLKSGISVGPMIECNNFNNHEINFDKSLGDMPPFIARPLARLALFASKDLINFILFDGRPESYKFPGVTPEFASNFIMQNYDIEWGCFLDPGQTARLNVRDNDNNYSFGNKHYLKWPINQEDEYIWVPELGRPIASSVTI